MYTGLSIFELWLLDELRICFCMNDDRYSPYVCICVIIYIENDLFCFDHIKIETVVGLIVCCNFKEHACVCINLLHVWVRVHAACAVSVCAGVSRYVRECVCVCVRERERGGGGGGLKSDYKTEN